MDGKLESLEKSRHQAHGQLSEHLKTVTAGQDQLRRETASLVTALRAPATRGRWGELQLKRVCEMAGMIEHCDFEQQSSADTDEGRVRPDLIVKLPGGMNVVVDAKVPLEAYLKALETEDEDERAAHLEAYGRHVRDHLRKLGAKSYQDSFSPTPEFVVLFLPSEAFHSAALEQVPDLIQEGVDNKVLIATPTSLIGLLKVVAYGWRQERMAESAEEVAELGPPAPQADRHDGRPPREARPRDQHDREHLQRRDRLARAPGARQRAQAVRPRRRERQGDRVARAGRNGGALAPGAGARRGRQSARRAPSSRSMSVDCSKTSPYV